MILDIEYWLSCPNLNEVTPRLPVIMIFDEKADEHAWIHFLDAKSSESPGVTGINLRGSIVLTVFVPWESSPSHMRIQVEKRIALDSDEIMR